MYVTNKVGVHKTNTKEKKLSKGAPSPHASTLPPIRTLIPNLNLNNMSSMEV